MGVMPIDQHDWAVVHMLGWIVCVCVFVPVRKNKLCLIFWIIVHEHFCILRYISV